MLDLSTDSTTRLAGKPAPDTFPADADVVVKDLAALLEDR
jgi:hypothetical protein